MMSYAVDINKKFNSYYMSLYTVLHVLWGTRLPRGLLGSFPPQDLQGGGNQAHNEPSSQEQGSHKHITYHLKGCCSAKTV